jgi:PilZ domain-containing protein
MEFSREQGQVPQNTEPERRANARFPLTLGVRYAAAGQPASMGTGRTIDISSSGLRFSVEAPLQAGQRIDVYIDWPVLLEGGVKLQLVVWGEVVRTDGGEAALQIQKHDFRTRRVGLRPAKELAG